MQVTKKQFTVLNELYNYYNLKLFHGRLPECMVSIVRSYRFHGAFSPNRWKEKSTNSEPIHEIVLNAFSLRREDKAWHSTLVHEMAHVECQVYGKGGCRGYHTKEWGRMMKKVGLYPSHDGKPGGKETGRCVTHYIVEGGDFEKAFNAISEKDIAKYNLPYQSLIALRTAPTVVALAAPGNPVPETKSGEKVGYMCSCGNKVWGKAGLDLHCNSCNRDFEIQQHPIKHKQYNF